MLNALMHISLNRLLVLSDEQANTIAGNCFGEKRHKVAPCSMKDVEMYGEKMENWNTKLQKVGVEDNEGFDFRDFCEDDANIVQNLMVLTLYMMLALQVGYTIDKTVFNVHASPQFVHLH